MHTDPKSEVAAIDPRHVDDMSPDERFRHRSRQLADLVVLAQHESLPVAASQLANYCETSRLEMLVVAIDQLSLLVGQLSEATTDDGAPS